MIDFIFTKDTHFRFGFPSPIGRKDTFEEEIDAKIDFTINFCKENGIKYWIIPGDVFDIKAPSKYSLAQVYANQSRLRKIKDSGITLLCISGNHDLPGASMDLYTSSFYHHCVEVGLIQDMQGLNEIEGTKIYGVPYFKSKAEVMEHLIDANEYEPDIVILHEHCVPKKEDLFGANFITYKELAKLDKIKYFCCGHLHKGYQTQENPYNENQVVINSWNFTRLARDYYAVNDLHQPTITMVKDGDYIDIPIPVKEFQYAFNIDKLKEAESEATDIADFMKQIEQFQTDKDLEIDNLPLEVANKVRDYMERAR